MRSRTSWIILLAGAILLGIASRVVHTGWVLFDKYLGDALYAVMVYVLISLCWKGPPARKAIAAMLLMTTIEMFQLTLIPAHLLKSGYLAVRIAARLMGTEFAYRDLVSYAAGILAIYAVDRLTCKIVR